MTHTTTNNLKYGCLSGAFLALLLAGATNASAETTVYKDVNGDGFISAPEQSVDVRTIDNDKSARITFERYDRNDNGEITPEEILSSNDTPREIRRKQALFSQWDLNNDEEVHLEELRKAMSEEVVIDVDSQIKRVYPERPVSPFVPNGRQVGPTGSPALGGL